MEPTIPLPDLTLADILDQIQDRLNKGSSPSLKKLHPLLVRRARHMDLVEAFGGKEYAVRDLYPQH